MNKGISFYFGYNVEPFKRAQMIKQAGFDCVITSADEKFKKQNYSIKKQVAIFKKVGLKLSSLHMAYDTVNLHYFWENCKFGEKLKKMLIKDVKIAKKYGFSCVVVHLLGEYSKVGERRLKQVLDTCQKLNIELAIENIDCQKLFLDVFKNIKHKYMKFCYDSGHNSVFDPDFDYLNEFGDKLVALHLHDNNGKADEHTLSKISASVNWDKIASQLSKHTNISLDYELFGRGNNKFSAEEFLKEAKAQADALEQKIKSQAELPKT